MCYLLQSLMKQKMIRYCDIIPINTNTVNTSTSVLEYLLPQFLLDNTKSLSYDFYSEIIEHNSECRVIYNKENNIIDSIFDDGLSLNVIPHIITLHDIYLRFQKCNKTGYFTLDDTEFYRENNENILLLGYISEDKNGLFLIDNSFTCRIYYEKLMFPELSFKGKKKVLVIIDKYIYYRFYYRFYLF